MKYKNKKLISLFFLLTLLVVVPHFAFGVTYTPIENLPTTQTTPGDFYDYVLLVYKILIGAVGVCAILMIIIGGFLYSTSAGNNASMEKAKTIITDAIVGLLIALIGWLLLFLINPDLVNIRKLSQANAGVSGSDGSTGAGLKKGDTVSYEPCSSEDNAKQKAKLPNGVTTKKDCPPNSHDNCVNMCGINDSAFSKLGDLSSKCGPSVIGGNIFVSAGTENHKTTNGANTFDLRCEPKDNACSDKLAQCVKDNYGSSARQICSYKNQYAKSCPYNEDTGITHIDFGS